MNYSFRYLHFCLAINMCTSAFVCFPKFTTMSHFKDRLIFYIFTLSWSESQFASWNSRNLAIVNRSLISPKASRAYIDCACFFRLVIFSIGSSSFKCECRANRLRRTLTIFLFYMYGLGSMSVTNSEANVLDLRYFARNRVAPFNERELSIFLAISLFSFPLTFSKIA